MDGPPLIRCQPPRYQLTQWFQPVVDEKHVQLRLVFVALASSQVGGGSSVCFFGKGRDDSLSL
jgi:hypothetical protein